MSDRGGTIGAPAGTLIDNLRMLNRKERFYLIGQALGKPTFQLSPEFRSVLGREFSVSVPEDAFVAMDYHLNWLYAALKLTYQPQTNHRYLNSDSAVEGNQEDIDLLVAWEESYATHIVMIEAKGATYFGNKQMESKAKRLEKVFASDGSRWTGVQPHFILMSPRKPSGRYLRTSAIPRWMLQDDGAFRWAELPNMDRTRLRAVMRCDEDGHPSAAGVFWTLAKG